MSRYASGCDGLAGVGLAVLMGLFAGKALAAAWTGTVGAFDGGANWEGGGVPANGASAVVANGGTVRFGGGSAAVSAFALGNGAGTGGTLEMTSGLLASSLFFVGDGVGGTGAVVQSGGSLSSSGQADPAFGIGYATNAVGTYALSNGAVTVSGGTFHVGTFGRGTLNQTGGAVTGHVWMIVARYPGSTGTYALSGGTLAQMGADFGLVVGERGLGVFTVSGTGVADLVGGLAISGGTGPWSTEGTGVVNLCAGGTINTPIVRKYMGANAAFNFDGGALRVRGQGRTVGNFMEGLTEARVKSGGAVIDTRDNTVTVNQSLLDGGGQGGLTKLGSGALLLGGANTYAGRTIVSNGVLVALAPSAVPGCRSPGRVNVCDGAGLAVGLGGSGAWTPADILALASSASFGSQSFFGLDTTRGSVAIGEELNLGAADLVKVGANALRLTGKNAYAGGTAVRDGILQADFGTGLPRSTHVALRGGTLSSAKGSLTCALGEGAGQVSVSAGQQGGFSAWGLPLQINLGGTAGALKWGSAAFCPDALILNGAAADQPLVLANGLDLAGGARTVVVGASAEGAAATLAGNVSDSVGGGSLIKRGPGTLMLTGTNRVGGVTTAAEGTLVFSAGSNALAGVVVTSGGQMTVAGAAVEADSGSLVVGSDGNGTLALCGGTLCGKGELILGQAAGSSGTLLLTNGAATCATLSVGQAGAGSVVQTGGRLGQLPGGGEWRIGGAASGVGNYVLSGGELDTGLANFQIGGYGQGVMLQTGGTVSCGQWPVIGRFVGGIGAYTLAGGTFRQTAPDRMLVVGERGTGTFSVRSGGTADLVGGLYLSGGSGPEGVGVVNLETGGTLVTPFVRLFNGAHATLNFDGGTLVARGRGAALPDFVAGLSCARVKAGGAVIDTGDNAVTIPQSLTGDAGADGGLTKRGAGTLMLAGANTYGGPTRVEAGTLRLSKQANAVSAATTFAVAAGAWIDLAGASLTVAGLSGCGGVSNGVLAVAGTVAPGGADAVGTLTLAASCALRGALLADVAPDGSGDLLQIRGALDVSGLTLRIQDPGRLARGKTYRLVTCEPGHLAGTFSSANIDGSRWRIGYDSAKGEVRLSSLGEN